MGSSNVLIVYFTIFVSAIQVNWEKNFKHLPFVTEACNLGESLLIFTEHIDNQTFCHILSLLIKALLGGQ